MTQQQSLKYNFSSNQKKKTKQINNSTEYPKPLKELWELLI